MKTQKLRKTFKEHVKYSLTRLGILTIIALVVLAILVAVGIPVVKVFGTLVNVFLIQSDDYMSQDSLYQMHRDLIESSDSIVSWTASITNDAAQLMLGILSLAMLFLIGFAIYLVSKKLVEEYCWEANHLSIAYRRSRKGC